MRKETGFILAVLTAMLVSCSTKSGDNVRIMSFNIRVATCPDGDNDWDHRRVAAGAAIRSVDPDIVCIEEALATSAAELMAETPAYSYVFTGRDEEHTGEGCAIAYKKDRYEMVRYNDFWLSETPDVCSKGWDAACRRVALYAFLRDKRSGDEFIVVCTHLDHIGREAREKGLLLMCDTLEVLAAMDGGRRPIYAMGDFNMTPDAPELIPLRRRMRNAQETAPVSDSHTTFNGFGTAEDKGMLIDYIFYKNICCHGYRVVTEDYGVPYVSDHYPIVADFVKEEEMLKAACNTKAGSIDLVTQTYCNPIDIDYSYMVYNSEHNLSYRSGADPAVVEFRGEYYMFVTRSHGYWHSTDMTHWDFITPQSIWYPQGCNAPAAHNYKDSLLYVCGDPSGSMSVLYSDDPKSGKWRATAAILHDLQDPDLFIDDDGTAYMFWGSSNVFPIRGKKLNREDRFLVAGETFPVIQTDAEKHGWERFGENHSDTRIAAYIEGPWLTKYHGKYYMQYAAPGTEFNVYGDGVYVSDNIEGPYTYQRHNPMSYKPGGYMNGAGHGSTVIGPDGTYWHYGTMSLSACVNWERRICAYPTFFDEDGIMYSQCDYGDWPHYAPNASGKKGAFTGWMLLSYGKTVTASSFQPGGAREAEGFAAWNKPKVSPDFQPRNVTDENCKTYWLADTNTDKEWLMVDLGSVCTVNAIQVNFHDHYNNIYTRSVGLRCLFGLEGSVDGEHWTMLEDRSRDGNDAPNAYICFKNPVKARYIRYRNVKVPMVNLAISGLRVFGRMDGKEAPSVVENFHAERQSDRRDAKLTWDKVEGATGYNIYWGIAPDKMYLSWLVYGEETTELMLRCLSTDEDYHYAIEAFNEGGISTRMWQ